MPCPPVDRITPVRSCRMRALVASSVGVVMHSMMPSGAPASTAALYRIPAVSQVHRLALGWGLSTIALPAFSDTRLLYMAVEVGLVVGRIAATTPTGTP